MWVRPYSSGWKSGNCCMEFWERGTVLKHTQHRELWSLVHPPSYIRISCKDCKRVDVVGHRDLSFSATDKRSCNATICTIWFTNKSQWKQKSDKKAVLNRLLSFKAAEQVSSVGCLWIRFFTSAKARFKSAVSHALPQILWTTRSERWWEHRIYRKFAKLEWEFKRKFQKKFNQRRQKWEFKGFLIQIYL